MYSELKFILDDFDSDSVAVLNYWYDGAYEEAVDVIGQFSEDDWQKLLEEYPKKSDFWKERLAYCMTDPGNPHQIRILEDLLHTDNGHLFAIAADVIRVAFDPQSLHDRDLILRKIDWFLPAADKITAWILQDLQKKLHG